MDIIYIGLATLFIYGVYDISGIKKYMTEAFSKEESPYMHKFFNCFFCTTFWISLYLTFMVNLHYPEINILAPVYFSGFLYLIIKVRWK